LVHSLQSAGQETTGIVPIANWSEQSIVEVLVRPSNCVIVEMSRRAMMADKIPHNALVVVADGTGARFFRNSGHEKKVLLSAEGEFKPTTLLDDGPAGKRPPESSNPETDEATFAKQLAKELYRRAHRGNFAALVLIADPQTLGQIRPTLHKEVRDRLVSEIGKTLTKSSITDIQKVLN
jgi:protein required for attachment to host cells